MVAYHFPPQKGSSGIQRTLRFCRYLPEFGWRPIVLSVHPRAYDYVTNDMLADVPQQTLVRRAMAFDAERHFAVRGRYPRFLAIPDRWSTWLIGGVVTGLKLIRQHRPKAIWSTYPIATAHLIGLALHKITGLPWIADFRDPMAQEGYPPDPLRWKSFKWIEEKALSRAYRSLFTSPTAIRDYQRIYPTLSSDRYVLLENGYDEEVFDGLATSVRDVAGADNRRLVLLHSGIVYTEERDPTFFFAALGELKRRGQISALELEIRFRASSNSALLAQLARVNDVEDLVTMVPTIGYSAALTEMQEADALLVMQASSCNAQIPAKVYEYMRVGRPILALTDSAGDTADVLMRAGISEIIPLQSTQAIIDHFPGFLARLKKDQISLPDPEFVDNCSRRLRTRQLALLLDEAAATRR